MKGVVRLLSSICRQFLIGLARLDRGSSRESVSTLVEQVRLREPISVGARRQNRYRCTRPVTRFSNKVVKIGVSKAQGGSSSKEFGALPLC